MRLDDFLDAHRFTHQTRREIAEWLPEIACREKASVGEIVGGLTIQNILLDKKMNAPQKSKKIRNALYRMRFPEYSRLQDNWNKTARAANPAPSKIRFIPSPGFEKKRLEIKISVDDVDEALKLVRELGKIDNDVWDELMWPQ